MTPTLLGRWETRLFLLVIPGGLVTAVFAAALDSFVPFYILWGVLALGLVWDVLFIWLQKFRWDHDWPPVLQLAAGVVEGLTIFGLVYGLQLASPLPSVGVFWLHYGSVWVVTFALSQSAMRILFPRWRFNGGEWL